jgi:hypothetical protein
MPSFGRKVKPFAPCKRFLNGVKKAKLPDHYRPQFHLSLLEALALMGTWRHLAAKAGTSKGRGKQWQTTTKNLSRMQSARAIPVPTKTGPKLNTNHDDDDDDDDNVTYFKV